MMAISHDVAVMMMITIMLMMTTAKERILRNTFYTNRTRNAPAPWWGPRRQSPLKLTDL